MRSPNGLLLSVALSCISAPVLGAAAGCLFVDGFESGDMCAWMGLCPPPVPSAGASLQIQSARDTPDGAASVAITGALVTYVKETIGSDQGGFFVQAELTGPALFVAVDPASLSPPPAAGMVVSFTITEMGTSYTLREALAVSGWSASGTGAWLPCYRQVVSNALDLVSSLDSYESELVSLQGTIVDAFASAGIGFESAQLETAGITGDSNLKLRVPTFVRDAADLTQGCTIDLFGSPLWRFNAQAQPSVWVLADLSVRSCPAPEVLSAVAPSTTEVAITFSRKLDPASVLANGSQFSFDNGLTAVAATAVDEVATVTTSDQTPSTTYTVTVASTVLDMLGAGVPGTPGNQATFNSIDAFTVGGTVSGLAGSGLVLQNNGGDDLPVFSDGAFTFATALLDGSSYDVTVLTQPSALVQTCGVTAGSGTLAGANVVTVEVTCTTDTFTVGGTVTGLAGAGLTLQNNLGDDLPIVADGLFTFDTPLVDGSSYVVTVLSQPTNLSQTCTVTADGGTLAGANVTDVQVDCTTDTFTVGGTVSGLAGSGLVLQNNAGDNLPVIANGAFAFTTALLDGSSYDVTVLTQPSAPAQSCTVTAGAGTLAGANVGNVQVNCVLTYTVGGTITGLAGTGLVIQNNLGDDLALSANGAFTFSSPLGDGSSYSVTVLSQPTGPSQACVITNGTGTVTGANVTNVQIDCVTNSFTIGGTVSGLAGSGLVLQNNLDDDLPITANGAFTFATPLSDTSTYSVTVAAHPTGLSQTCYVFGGSGTVSGDHVTTVTVSCLTSIYSVGGTVSGLAGTGLVLQNNLGDDLPIAADGAFTFATSLVDGSTYDVSVLNQPTGLSQTCTVTNAAGTLAGAHVTNVLVDCATNTYTVGGTVTGLAGTGLVLQNNGGDDLTIAADGPFSFATPLPDGSAFDITVLTQPTSPQQTCTVTRNGSGTLAGADMTAATIVCEVNYTVGGTVTGLTGTGLVLRNNGTDDLTIDASGPFSFATGLPSGFPYDVTVAAHPSATEACVVSNGSGTIAGANVTNVSVQCASELTALDAVAPRYPTNGANWNDYVDNDGADPYHANDISCPGTGPGYDACVHGGEKREVTVTGFTSCAGLTAVDALSVFDWTCDDSSGTATFVSVGLEDGAFLSDLLDFDAVGWRPNSVVIAQGGIPVALTPTTAWWGNSVALANDTDGNGTEVLGVEGGIYLVSVDPTANFSITANKIGLVAKPGLTVNNNGTGGSNMMPIFRPYCWVEGDFDGTGYQYVVQLSASFLVMRGVTLRGGGSAGFQVGGSNSNSMFRYLTFVDPSGSCLYKRGANNQMADVVLVRCNGYAAHFDSTSNFVVERLRVLDSNNLSLSMTNASDMVFRDIGVSGGVNIGVRVIGSQRITFEGVETSNNGTTGFQVDDSPPSSDIVIADLVSTNNAVAAEFGHSTTLVNALLANNNYGLQCHNDCVGINVSVVNSSSDFGGAIDLSSNDILMNAASSNGRIGLWVNYANNSVANIASADNLMGVYFGNMGSGSFAGVLKVGNNSNLDCYVPADTGDVGLIDDTLPAEDTVHEGLCLPSARSSMAPAIYGVTTAGSYIGKVSTDDSINPDDTVGLAVYGSITEWFDFDNVYRAWGLDGSAFPNVDHRGPCTTGDCRIWDWRVALSDTGDAGAPVLLDAVPLPTGADAITHQWLDGSTTTFLMSAVEFANDGIGNDNYLCESNEVCLYTPNIGAYQGHGILVSAGAFVPGPSLSNIILLRYASNGF